MSKEPTVRSRLTAADQYLYLVRTELRLAEPDANPTIRAGLRNLITTVGLAIDKANGLLAACEEGETPEKRRTVKRIKRRAGK